ncbi:MAG: hypothetical protein V3S16_01135 [Candidatus Desulfatibia sp.]|jgi:hypothetical protein|uniref:hypothetical protein n=1 Tax=Candidatus Desulfatibia sp. TaxID=3101189 RepID=UPI002F2EC1AE
MNHSDSKDYQYFLHKKHIMICSYLPHRLNIILYIIFHRIIQQIIKIQLKNPAAPLERDFRCAPTSLQGMFCLAAMLRSDCKE